MKLLGALPVAVALVLALAGCDSSGSAGPDSAARARRSASPRWAT